jgi:hypothetical protein
MASVVAVKVVAPGEQAETVKACLAERRLHRACFRDSDVELYLTSSPLARQARAQVAMTLDGCHPGWRRYLRVL